VYFVKLENKDTNFNSKRKKCHAQQLKYHLFNSNINEIKHRQNAI